MIRELLEMLFIRRLSFPVVEKELNIDHATLQNRIGMMIHLGYLKKTSMPFDSCDGGCMHCSKKMEAACSEGGEGKSLTGFELTLKGKRLLEKQGKEE